LFLLFYFREGVSFLFLMFYFRARVSCSL